MKVRWVAAVVFLLGAVPAYGAEPALPAGTYTLDKSHASLVFQVSHLGFSNYTMTFDDFDAVLTLDPQHPEQAKLSATVEAQSLDLPHPPEGFLQTMTMDENWLNASVFPKITFTSTAIKMTGEKTADIEGDLALLGVKKPVVLHAIFNGGYAGSPMDPDARIGFSATGSFKRSDFGMAYGVPAPGTTMGVGDAVTFEIEAEFSGPENGTK